MRAVVARMSRTTIVRTTIATLHHCHFSVLQPLHIDAFTLVP